jgi:hypothetical protein
MCARNDIKNGKLNYSAEDLKDLNDLAKYFKTQKQLQNEGKISMPAVFSKTFEQWLLENEDVFD